MTELIGSIATVLAVTGVLLNNRICIWCFPVWMVSNSLSAWIHYDAEIWSVFVRDLIFLALAVWGWRQWRKRLK